MAAMITLADPSIAFATGLEGLLSWLAIWAADRPGGVHCCHELYDRGGDGVGGSSGQVVAGSSVEEVQLGVGQVRVSWRAVCRGPGCRGGR
jgi:hypothetical protein